MRGLVLTVVVLAVFVSPSLSKTCNSSKQLSVVFVPFPCPSTEAYEETQAQMDIVIGTLVATGVDFEVIIVRAPYALAEHLSCITEGTWWGPTILEMQKRYRWYRSKGYVSLVDTFSDNEVNYTPKYFIYGYGSLLKSGNIQEVVKDVQKILGE